MAQFKLAVRAKSRVSKERHDDLDAALDSLAGHAGALVAGAGAAASGGKLMRKFEPVQQVVGRIEIRGPGVAGGVDVRGDGSAEAFTGRIGRSLVEQRPGETAVQALRRAFGSPA